MGTNIGGTTTAAPVFQYASQPYMDRNPKDTSLWCMVKNTGGNYELFNSTNQGASWATAITYTRANVQEWANIFIDNLGFLHWAYRTNESSQDRIYYNRLDLNKSTLAWQSELLMANPANGGVAGAVNTGLAITSILYSPNYVNYRVPIAVGSQQGGNQGVVLLCVQGDTFGTAAVVNNDAFTSPRQWLYAATGRITPSITIEHNGDGKSAGYGPHLWVVFGRTQIFVAKLAWNGSKWITPISPVYLAPNVNAQNAVAGRYDGQGYFVVSVQNPDATDTVALYRRNNANTMTTKLVSPVHPTGVITNCTFNHAFDSYRVFAVGTSTTVLYYTDYVKASATWTSWGTVDATGVLSSVNFGVKDTVWPYSRHDIYMMQSTQPKHFQQTLSYSPNTPTWAAPISGDAQDVNASLLLDWNFSDPDPLDTQLAYMLSRQIGAGTLNYWRASDTSWQTTEQVNTSGTTSITLASSWAAGSDANYTFKVKTRDQGSNDSSYSAGIIVTPSVKVNPTLTSPGATVTTAAVTGAWTVSEQIAFRVRLSGAVSYDSGWTNSTSTTFTPPTVLANAQSITFTLNTKNNEGLASSDVSQAFTVSFTPPNTPTLVNTAVPSTGVIGVAITNPAGGVAVTYQDLYRRVGTDDTTKIRVATGLSVNVTYNDYTAVSGVTYQYQALAFGTNGTGASSAWTA